jgi:hypothetical protein
MHGMTTRERRARADDRRKRRQPHHRPSSGARRARSRPSVQSIASERSARDDEIFVRWIPVMVPLFAVMMALLTYLIAWAVL